MIEFLVAAALAVILAAVAFPSFQEQLRKGRRADAIAALGAVQLAQERHRSSNPQYTTNLTGSPGDAANPGLGSRDTSDAGHYRITISSASASSYRIEATAVAGGSQARDTDCATMAIQYAGGAISYLAGSSGGGLAADTSGRCWPR